MSRTIIIDGSDDESEYGPPIAVINRPRSHRGSDTHSNRENLRVHVDGNFLNLPSEYGGRLRGSSMGAQARPNVINLNVERDHSHERARPHSRPGSHSSEEEFRYREHQRTRSKRRSDLDDETILKLEELRILKKEDERRRRERELKDEIERAKAREYYEAQQKKEKEKREQEKYVEKWKMEEAAKKEKAKREKEEEDRKFEERFKKQFMEAGYSQAYAEAVLQKKKDKEKKEKNVMAIDLSRPTWIKVHRRYLVPETLDAYYLPWEWDEVSLSPPVFVHDTDNLLQHNSEYIIIKKWISQDLQDELFEHTKKIKEKKLIMGPIEKDTTTILKVRDKSKDNMYLVRKKSKSPARRGLFG